MTLFAHLIVVALTLLTLQGQGARRPPVAHPCGDPVAFQLLLDPDYAYTNAYGLRWNAPQETAYPSTFVVNKSGIVTFAQTSKAHGDRVPTDTVLKAVDSIKAELAFRKERSSS